MSERSSLLPSHTVAVIGLGYVGLTTALLAARAGFTVLGVDTDAARRAMIEAGETPFSLTDPDLHALCIEAIQSGALRVSDSLAPADILFLAVPTPVLASGMPDEQALRTALTAVATCSPAFQLLVLESTLAPGTTARLVAPMFERATDRVAHAPERVMPGKLLANATSLPRVIGVESDRTWASMHELYTHIYGAPLRRATWANAELSKTAENAWRDMNIAFANTLALACEAAGGDFDTVRMLVNESPGRQVLKAGVGVGGSCLPKDSYLLGAVLADNGYLRAARAVNESMPHHAAMLAAQCVGGNLTGKRVLVLGASYLENVQELAHSPALAFAARLRELGAQVLQHDPHVPVYQGEVTAMAEGCQLIALATDHDAYQELDFEMLRRVVPSTTAFLDLRCSRLAAVAGKAGFLVTRLGDSERSRELHPCAASSKEI